jgi:hypothetical protein
MDLELSDRAATTAGILLLAIVTIEWGGMFLLRIARGKVPVTPFQKAFARAGHAHAGVLVILSLVTLLYLSAADLSGLAETVARSGVPIAAVLMSAGFFAASAGKGRTEPNGAIVVIYIGAAFLAAGVLTLGIGLLTA